MIHFFVEDIHFDTGTLSSSIFLWLQNIVYEEGATLGELNYIFCSDAYLLEINQKYLDHDYFTDIITFDNSEQSRFIEGDIFISIERVYENAFHLHIDQKTELLRVICHGLLHLLGYDDSLPSEQILMRTKEDHYLSSFTF